MKSTLLTLLALCIAAVASAQLVITAADFTQTITFDTSIPGVNNGAFTGAGFAPSPASGQLDSDAFGYNSTSNSGATFGLDESNGTGARGTSMGGVNLGGIYAFDIDNSPSTVNRALGIQPTENDFTQGSIGLQLVNNNGTGDILEVTFSYEVYFYNDQGTISGVTSRYAQVNGGFGSSAGGSTFSQGATNVPASWQSAGTVTRTITIPEGGFGVGGSYFIDFQIDGFDFSGTPNFQTDEVAIDNITITVTSDNVLPVELAYFTAEARDDHNLLTWQTLTETNNEGFEVERSYDGESWEVVGWVEGVGESYEPLEYAYRDTELAEGVMYYRLLQYDWDGAAETSEVVSIVRGRTTEAPTMYAFPNPTSDVVTLSGTGEVVYIYTIAGQLVTTLRGASLSEITVDVSELQPGIYLLVTRYVNGATSTMRLVIE